MRIDDVLRWHLEGVETIVDVTSRQALDVSPYVHAPEGVRYEITDASAAPVVGRGTLVLALVGPEDDRHGRLEDFVDDVLPNLDVGAKGLLLLGWEAGEVPMHRLLDPLGANRCQVLGVTPLRYRDIHVAVAVERVDALRPLSAYLASDPDDAVPVDDLRSQLRLANEHLLTDFAARVARARLDTLEREGLTGREPGRPAVPRSPKVDQLEHENRRLVDESARLERELASVRSRLTALETSTAYQVGVALAHARRSPAREAVKLPARALRLYRERAGGAAAPRRPAEGRPTRSVNGGVADLDERNFLIGVSGELGPKTRLAVAGILRESTVASLAGDVDVLRLTPNAAGVLFDRFDADLLLLESAAARPGQPWALLGAPAGTVRDRELAAVLAEARRRGVPTVLWWTSPPHENPGLHHVAAECDLVVAEPSLAVGRTLHFTRGVQLDRFNPLGADERSGVLHVGSLDRSTPRGDVEPLLRLLRSVADRGLSIYGDFSPYVEDPITACGFPEDLAPHVVGDASWRDVPALYRRAAAIVSTGVTASCEAERRFDVGDAEKLACGAALLRSSHRAPTESPVEGPDPAPPDVAAVWRVVREMFPSVTTAVEIGHLAAALGIRETPLRGRAVSVVATLEGRDQDGELVRSVLEQRHVPAELVVVVPEHSLVEATMRALAEVEGAGITVRTMVASRPGTWEQVARRATGTWLVPWRSDGGHDPCHLLDLLIGADMSGASAVGRGDATGYVGTLAVDGALIRRSVVEDRPHLMPEWRTAGQLDRLAQVGERLFCTPAVST